MSDAPDPIVLAERIQELEARLARLEHRLDDDLPEVPWHVIVAAVAAVLPNARILGVTQPGGTSVQRTHLSFWSFGGRLDHFGTHRVR
ncbi:MAG: hypothetical protein EA425_17900 [Puniceicoccaceae bacterium]|nr:MAG: hypothetical protein EA425_17900 [Puniceicoccaceae bacterium]